MRRPRDPGQAIALLLAAVFVVAIVGATFFPFAPVSAAATVASCDRATVQAAVDAAPDGETITVPGGACTWSSPVTLRNDRGVTLACASVGACDITTTGNGAVYFDSLAGANDRTYRITGFDFRNTGQSQIIWILGNGTATGLRIDHNTFDLAPDSTAILLGSTDSLGNYYGVVDHNRLTGAGNSILVHPIGKVNPSPPPSPLGTARNLFVEDNVVTFPTMTNAGRGCADAWGGAAIVWRHNQTTNCLVASHGTVHAGGPQNFELYANEMRVDAGSVGAGVADGYRLFHHHGSGEFVAFDNRFTAHQGKTSSALEFTHYRSATPVAAGYDPDLGRCDGTNPIDGNRAPTATYFGYPCWRQPGRDFVGNLVPMYTWNNRWTDTGAKVSFSITDPWGASAPSVFDHVKANRDYYDAVSASPQTSASAPFNGTAGMGFGPLARRPATCTTGAEAGGGVGYFATDQGAQGILYQCTAANTWTAWYAPYAYPHPLVSGIPAPPPIAPNQPPGAKGNANLRCGGLAPTIVGTAKGERIRGTAKRDVIAGLGGNDLIIGAAGNDVICGGAGNDTILGGSGADRLFGDTGADRILGGSGNDTIFAGPGRDRLDGRDGRDVCLGGRDLDRFAGCERRKQ